MHHFIKRTLWLMGKENPWTHQGWKLESIERGGDSQREWGSKFKSDFNKCKQAFAQSSNSPHN